ncbi:MAG: hypothetical protein ACREYE_17980 [Gammaproteobacteria bacterium]
MTKKYHENDALPVGDKPDWYRSLKAGAQAIASKQLERTTSNLDAAWSVPAGASHGVFLEVDGGNPLLSAAPNINAEIYLGFRGSVGIIEYMVSSEHDGFPNYQLQLNGKVIYAWDCVAQGETPGALKPPMDQTVSIGWSKL